MTTTQHLTGEKPKKSKTSVPQVPFVDRLRGAFPYAALIGYSFIALVPIILIILNSFKERRDLFRVPYQPPIWFTFEGGFQVINNFTLEGYESVFDRAQIFVYFGNSILITSISLTMILLLGSMIAYALTEYKFPGLRILNIYLIMGIMIPARLGTVSMIELMTSFGIYNTRLALILVYVARGLPIALFILSEFMRQVPRELKEAARVDGANEYWILFRLILPLIRPALATVLVFQLIPIWNDLWFPLTLAPGENVRTVTLGVSSFAGQYKQDWSALLAALTLAMIPVTTLYVIFSRQFISGLTRGALK
ncbi:MAG: carbohydrate ABC transporter permease [Chloroflexota bacterium]